MFDVVVVGGAAFDYLVHAPDLPAPDRPVHGDVFLKGPGGHGFNQAVAAARLGARVALVARIGGDPEGDGVLGALHRERIDTTWVLRDERATTTAVLIAVDRQGRKQIAAVPGAGRLSVEDIEAAVPAIGATAVLLMSLEAPLEALRRARQLARRARHVLDPAPARTLPDDLLVRLDVIKPNAAEAGTLTGIRVEDRAGAARAATVLRARGVRAAVIAGAGPGVLIAERGGQAWVPHHEVATVDTTGAGDALAAGLAVGVAERRSLADAVRFGVAAAALTTTRVGVYGALPKRAEVEELLRKAEGRM